MKKRLFTLATTATIIAGMTLGAYADGPAVKETDNISGDLKVSSFFAEKTDAMKLESGDQIKLTFKDKSNGTTNNWDNFVLAVVSSDAVGGDLYPGEAEEVLIIRADSWGWGGGRSDFKAPQSIDGVSLNFATDVSDWDAWRAATQKGVNCEVSLSRDGNTFNYEAKIGDNKFKMSATSGVDVPETCYVFLTGENCELSNIKSEKSKIETSDKNDKEENEKDDNKDDDKNDGETEIIRQSDAIQHTQLIVVDNGDDGGNSSTVVVLAVVVVVVLVVVSGLVLATRKKK